MTTTTAQRFAHFEELIGHNQAGSISIIMPTHEAGRQVQQNAIRFKNLLSTAMQRLVDSGESSSTIEKRLSPLHELQQNNDFWQHRTSGLAIYFSDESLTTIDLHQSAGEFVFISEEFFLPTCVLDAVSQHAYTVLALTWEGARLYRCNQSSLEQIENEQFPVSLRDVVLPPDPEEQLQFRTQSTGSGGTMFHGQGEGEGMVESDRHRFLTDVGKRLNSINDQQSLPLIAVGTQELLGEFAKATKVQAAQQIELSPDSLSESQFEKRVHAELDSKKSATAAGDAMIEQIENAIAQQRGSRSVDQILEAATNGQVDCFLVEHRVGYAPAQIDKNQLAKINSALIKILQMGGSVASCADCSLGSSAVAAIYRY